MNDETTGLQSLSKLKKAGKLRYWRGTIEIPEIELHAICDEIQAEHDRAIAATLGEKPRDNTEKWLLNTCNQAAQDYVTQLERERDEWKTKCETREFAYKQADAERKRYSEQIDELLAEREELKAFSELLETAAHDKLGVTLFGVDYVTEDFMLHVRDTLTAELDEWKAKLADLCQEDKVHAKPRTLTAEQVREAIERHSAWAIGNGPIFRDGAYEEIAAELGSEINGDTSDGHTPDEAIARIAELSARAERTCRIEGSYLNDFTSNYECWYEFEMQCGYEFAWDEKEPPNHCPNCGAKVIDE